MASYAPRIASVFILVLGWLSVSATQAAIETSEVYIAGNYVVGSPRAELCPLTQARLSAMLKATAIHGAFVMRGLGNSMIPLYRSGTLLVIKPVAFEQLSRGMSVVFSINNKTITHVLVAKTKDGWRTTGLNNRRPDYMTVNADNIRGVVVAAFTPIKGQTVAMR